MEANLNNTESNSRKAVFFTRSEYNAVKNTVSFKNFNVVHSPRNNEDSFWLYSKK